MITAFYILFAFALLSIVLHRSILLKPFALLGLVLSFVYTLLGASENTKLFELIVEIVLFAVVLHESDEISITQTLFIGASSILLLESKSLLSFVISFESLSLISVILVSQIKTTDQAEGAVKMFIAGALATGILFLGLSFYVMGGGVLLEPLKTENSMFETIGVFIMLIALFYKLTIVPFHGWAADTYAKVSHSHAALLSGVAKTVVVIASFNIFAPFLAENLDFANPLIITLALITMTLGNFLALFRENLAQMLSYSSIAHAGYMILAFVAVQSEYAKDGILYMSIAYIFMQSAAFLVLDVLRKSYKIRSLKELSGFSKQSPVLAALFSVQLLSLAGIPLLAGFLGKAVLFYAVVDAGLWWVVLIALLNSALSVAYYAWVIKSIYFDELNTQKVYFANIRVSVMAQIILVVGTIYFGIFAGLVFGI